MLVVGWRNTAPAIILLHKFRISVTIIKEKYLERSYCSENDTLVKLKCGVLSKTYYSLTADGVVQEKKIQGKITVVIWQMWSEMCIKLLTRILTKFLWKLSLLA